MKKTTKPKKIEKIIHIHAKCNAFEIFEQLPQDRALRRLLSIREMFMWNKNRFKKSFDDNLVVKTRIVNPTLF